MEAKVRYAGPTARGYSMSIVSGAKKPTSKTFQLDLQGLSAQDKVELNRLVSMPVTFNRNTLTYNGVTLATVANGLCTLAANYRDTVSSYWSSLRGHK